MMKLLDILTAVLLIIGGLNWGLYGLFNFDLIAAIFGQGMALAKLSYALVGLSALYQAFLWQQIQGRCSCGK